jgi:hypothetical protein
MSVNYTKPLVACNVILLALCGYLIFQNQQLQSSEPPSSLDGLASVGDDPAQLPAEGQDGHQSSIVKESSENATMQGVAVDIGIRSEGKSNADGMQLGSSRDEQLVSQQHAAAAELFQSGYSSRKEKLESLLVTGNYQ